MFRYFYDILFINTSAFTAHAHTDTRRQPGHCAIISNNRISVTVPLSERLP
ncbi:hypothetical protein HMPREF1548_04526 [Clostridium sp. KLE 1755]|nr:hypothetical protein HMPREF1548_04526 [Clostridium sp. KLE 1755]